MERRYYVYLLASQRNGTLYCGVTNNLARRVWEHKQEEGVGFTKRYGVNLLVWYEGYGDIYAAIRREKQIKRWRREWKIKLIEALNPQWCDLYETLNQ